LCDFFVKGGTNYIVVVVAVVMATVFGPVKMKNFVEIAVASMGENWPENISNLRIADYVTSSSNAFCT